MNAQQQLVIEQRVANEAKSSVAAYLLWFFGWGFGLHRMYLGRWGSGLAMAALSVLGLLTWWMLGLGFVPWAIAWLWNLVDFVLIPGMIAQDRNDLRYRLSRQMMAG